MIRSFFAIELPDEVKEEAGRAIGALARLGADVKWVKPENAHVTLKFLGQISPETAEAMAQAAAEALAEHPAPRLRLSGAGVFPNPRKARVVWMGLAGDQAPAAEMAKVLDQTAARFGVDSEKRAFKSHLTLGRVRSGRGRGRLVDALAELKIQPIEFTAGEVVLYRSDLKPTGPVYTPLGRLPLKT
jgi:2'-5' RNA ligase